MVWVAIVQRSDAVAGGEHVSVHADRFEAFDAAITQMLAWLNESGIAHRTAQALRTIAAETDDGANLRFSDDPQEWDVSVVEATDG